MMHFVNGNPLHPPFPSHLEPIVFGLGCFWGAERIFWETDGVFTTAVGYAGGKTATASYEEVCGGTTGHAEVVLVVFDPTVLSRDEMLRIFWEAHDPTQGMRQGNDRGTQYRSTIYTASPEQLATAEKSLSTYQEKLTDAGFGMITTDIEPLTNVIYAEDYHQQYLAKNIGGYCGIGGTGVSCPTALASG